VIREKEHKTMSILYIRNLFYTSLIGSLNNALNWSGIIGFAIVGGYAKYQGQNMTLPDGVLQSIPFALEAAAITGLIIFLIRFFVLCPYKMYQQEKKRADRLELKIKDFFSEYKYSIHISSINLEEFRQFNKENQQIISRKGRFAILLKNTLNKPIKYNVERLVLNGLEQTIFHTRTGIIGAHTTGMFYTEQIDLDISNLEGKLDKELEIDISYGHPEKHEWIIKKVINLECYPFSGGTKMLYKNDAPPIFIGDEK
jgi:hypothetical protein